MGRKGAVSVCARRSLSPAYLTIATLEGFAKKSKEGDLDLWKRTMCGCLPT